MSFGHYQIIYHNHWYHVINIYKIGNIVCSKLIELTNNILEKIFEVFPRNRYENFQVHNHNKYLFVLLENTENSGLGFDYIIPTDTNHLFLKEWNDNLENLNKELKNDNLPSLAKLNIESVVEDYSEYGISVLERPLSFDETNIVRDDMEISDEEHVHEDIELLSLASSSKSSTFSYSEKVSVNIKKTFPKTDEKVYSESQKSERRNFRMGNLEYSMDNDDFKKIFGNVEKHKSEYCIFNSHGKCKYGEKCCRLHSKKIFIIANNKNDNSCKIVPIDSLTNKSKIVFEDQLKNENNWNPDFCTHVNCKKVAAEECCVNLKGFLRLHHNQIKINAPVYDLKIEKALWLK